MASNIKTNELNVAILFGVMISFFFCQLDNCTGFVLKAVNFSVRQCMVLNI